MKASAIFNLDGSVTLIKGIDVYQFEAVSEMINFCKDKSIEIKKSYTIDNQ